MFDTRLILRLDKKDLRRNFDKKRYIMYHERMSETNERSLWGKVTGLFKKEQKPTPEGITSQARPMTSEEDLAQLKDWQGPKGRTIIQAESRDRQEISKKKAKIMNTTAAVGTAITMAGIGVAANTPNVNEAVSNVGQGISDTLKAGVNRLRAGEEPIDALQAKAAADYKSSRAPLETPKPSPTPHN